MISAKHVGIKIDVTGPHDGAELRVYSHGLEDIVVVTDRREYAAGLQQPGQIDLVHRAIAEGQPKPALRARLDLDDRCTGSVHGSGAIGAGCSGT